jgi:tetratricopeptide (TPR) repeat protein
MPKVLEDRASHRPIPGVLHLGLEGLAPNDVLRIVKQAGIYGDSSAILHFAEQFGRHALVLRIVCGMITDYRPKPGDFDAWRADPYTGGGLRLSELPLVQTYTHILEYAFRGLGEKQRELLSRIAVLSDSAEYNTVAILNPFLPPRPDEVQEPSDPAARYEWHFQMRLDQATSPEEREAIEAERSAFRAERESEYQEQKQAYERYQQALRAYYDSAEFRQAIAAFHVALSDLEDRGLLQWDRDTNTYDLHPVVRAYAFEQLEERDRTRTFNALGDHFASLPPEKMEGATELSHVKNSLEIMRALIGAGRFEEAHGFYRGDFSNSLYYSIGAYHVVVELISPLLRYDYSGRPLLTSRQDRSFVMNELAIVMDQLGKFEEAIILYRESLRLELELENWIELAIRLENFAYCSLDMNQLASAGQITGLAYELADAANDQYGLTSALVRRMALATILGMVNEAESLLTNFRQREQPPFAMYRPGRAEYQLAALRFFQDSLTEVDLEDARQISVDAYDLHRLAALRAEWELSRDNPKAALEAIEQALAVTRRTGSPAPGYFGIRAQALARLGFPAEAREALAEAEEIWDGRLPAFPRFAAETYLALGDREQAREWVRRAYPLAWADGPPYIRWYELKRCRELMAKLGEPEPQLPSFDRTKVEPIPFEAEIRAVIAKLKAERAEAERIPG